MTQAGLPLLSPHYAEMTLTELGITLGKAFIYFLKSGDNNVYCSERLQGLDEKLMQRIGGVFGVY